MTELFLAIATLLVSYQATPAQDPKSVITDQEAIEFAKKIERVLLEGKVEAFSDALDMDALLEASAQGLDLASSEIKTLLADKNFEIELARRLVPASGYSLRFLGLRSVRSHRGPLFRVWGEDGFNYHLYKLRKTPDGSLRISDMLFFSSGEWQSSVFRRVGIAILLDDPDRRSKVDAKDAESARNLVEMRQLARLSKEGQSLKALELFDSLPESVRKDRQAQAMRIVSANKIGGAAYVKAEEEFRRLFPDDLAIDLVCLGGFFHRKEFDKALQCLDRIDRLVGGDPALDVPRGNVYMELGNLAEAKKTGRQAAKYVPYLQEPRWLLVRVALKEKAHAETVTLLSAVLKDFNLELEDLTTIEDYAEFVKSPEYRDWMKSRAAK